MSASDESGSGAPTWTVVLPTSGRRSTLDGCLTALAGLDPPSGGFEIVVADDSGTERPRLDAPLPAPARTVRVGGRGAAAARNAGARVARGRWLAFIDDDCLPERDWLRAFERAEAFPEGAGLGGRVRNGVVDNLAAVASQAVLDACHAHFNAAEPSFYASSNIAVPTAGYRAIGGFDEALPYAEDRAFWDSWRASGRNLGYAGEAVVWHQRSHTLADLWRQHAGYGRGAEAVHRRRGSSPRPDLSFYRRLARRAWAEPPRRRVPVLALAALTQVATLTGYLRAGPARRSRDLRLASAGARARRAP